MLNLFLSDGTLYNRYMRAQRAEWTFRVIVALLLLYGGFTAFLNINGKPEVFIPALVAFIVGVALLVVYLILYFLSRKKKKAAEEAVASPASEEPKEDSAPVEKEEPTVAETKAEEKEESVKAPKKPVRDFEYAPRRSSSVDDWDSGFVSQIGYGPVLDIRGNRIRDMRTNVYYRIEGNFVYCEGSGVQYEIRGSAIRSAFGGFLYEISGSSVRKTFGGHYAEYSGRYMAKYDQSVKYEIGASLNMKQALVVVVLLFGER